MDSYFYFVAIGKENAVRALGDDVQVAGSEVHAMKPNPHDPRIPDERWYWQSPRRDCVTEFPEDELLAHMIASPGFLGKVAAHRNAIRRFSAVIVCAAGATGLRGISVSESLLTMLAGVRGSIEIDLLLR